MLKSRQMKKQREPSAAGRLILEQLDRRGISQAKFARLVPISRTLLVDILWGRRSIPPATIRALSEALELTEGQRDELVLADAHDRIKRRQPDASQSASAAI